MVKRYLVYCCGADGWALTTVTQSKTEALKEAKNYNGLAAYVLSGSKKIFDTRNQEA